MKAIIFTVSVNSSPLDLTDATIKMQVRNANRELLASYGSALPLTGITITNAAGGVFRFDEKIVGIAEGRHNYDIEIKLSDGTVKTYIEGTFPIVQDVTHD